MKLFKKAVIIALALALALTTLAGCGEEVISIDGSGGKLTYWALPSGTTWCSSYNDLKSLQVISEKTGIEVEFIHPSSSRWEEQFNIMIASGEYPDIIFQNNWNNAYNGGLPGIYNDGIIIDLTEYVDGGKMPNFKKLLDENPLSNLNIRTDDGKIFQIGTIRDSAAMNASTGHQIRKDWLEKLNIDVPKTMTDWYNMLTAFKTKDPNGNGEADEIPYGDFTSQNFTNFAAAYRTSTSYYKKDGKLVYGPVTPEYKAFITEMNKWYKEGLIDPEFAAISRANLSAKVTTDKVGSYTYYIGSAMGSYLTAMADSNPEFDLVGAPWPVCDADGVQYNPIDVSTLDSGNSGAVVTTKCKDPNLAVKYLDYLFSEEATIIQNWGVEGETYEVVDGQYKYLDSIMNNPEGKQPTELLGKTIFPSLGAPVKYWLYDAYSQVQFAWPQQKEATQVWAQGENDLTTIGLKMTAEETDRRSQILTDMDTYRAEMYTKFIIGKEPLSKWDEYVRKMNEMGLPELMQIYETAHERYTKMAKDLGVEVK
ncbi:MAG: extracellular solute-binding protein [Ruminococcaceae bacterium]|nr:extracellular solute-binding protein [Oscillospiraceae bacterium]